MVGCNEILLRSDRGPRNQSIEVVIVEAFLCAVSSMI